jgi:16S rRNA U516 pseudouridylate synthase RsuA-like enzyme
MNDNPTPLDANGFIPLVVVLAERPGVMSRAAARRVITTGGVAVDGITVRDINAVVRPDADIKVGR